MVDDGGGEVLTFIVWILVSRLPWPVKIGLVALLGGGWFGFKLWRKRARENADGSDGSD